MTSIIDKVTNSLQKYKTIKEDKSTIEERHKLITQMRIDLTFFENLPPANPVDIRECILAREIYEYATFLAVEKEDIEGFELWNVTSRTFIIAGSTIMYPLNRFITHIIVMIWSLLLHARFQPYKDKESNRCAILFCICDILDALRVVPA